MLSSSSPFCGEPSVSGRSKRLVQAAAVVLGVLEVVNGGWCCTRRASGDDGVSDLLEFLAGPSDPEQLREGGRLV